MIDRVVVRRAAARDIREAAEWYRRISRELSDDFVRRVDDAIRLAQEHPLAFQVVHRTFRRVLLRRFPYSLFYVAGDDRLTIVAVLHQARGPDALESRRK